MPYTPNIVSTVLFESSDVAALRIPPGPARLSKWDLEESNVVWRGSMRLIEQEVIQEKTTQTTRKTDYTEYDQLANGDARSSPPHQSSPNSPRSAALEASSDPSRPYLGLRAKIELFNVQILPPSVGSLTSVKKDVQWGEIWYNPLDRISADGIKIANNSQDTVQITDSSKYYKIVVQLPDSGYHPRSTDEDDFDLIQIGLGLRFRESYQAISFSESLSLYRRRYRNFEEQYHADISALERGLARKTLNGIDDLPTISEKSDGLADSEFGNEDDEFDEFVSAS